MDTPLQRRIYALIRTIPRGRLMSYGSVAAALGKPRAPRAVGSALSRLPDGHDVPWWRVISASGRISTPNIHHTAKIQRSLLEAEGITFNDADLVDWDRFGWGPTPEEVAAAVAATVTNPEVGSA
jgi:methylated-DNA-protein-cysteine methyltransferase related protein